MAILINPEPINEVNFLRWHLPTAGPFDGKTFTESGECMKVDGITPEDIYALPIKDNDEISFIINAHRDLGNEANLYLFLLQNNTFTLLDEQSLEYITVGSDKYLQGIFTVSGIPDGQYNLVIAKYSYTPGGGAADIDGKTVELVSNPVRIINYQSAQHPTVFVKFRHSASQFNYPYAADLTYYNQFRIDALLTPSRPVENIATYEDRNRNTRFVGAGKLERVADFKTDHLDSRTHEAIAAMLLHNEILINGKQYQKADSYETELEGDVYALYQGQTRLKDLGFTQLTNNCSDIIT